MGEDYCDGGTANHCATAPPACHICITVTVLPCWTWSVLGLGWTDYIHFDEKLELSFLHKGDEQVDDNKDDDEDAVEK
jgi:hypothetical protein